MFNAMEGSHHFVGGLTYSMSEDIQLFGGMTYSKGKGKPPDYYTDVLQGGFRSRM